MVRLKASNDFSIMFGASPSTGLDYLSVESRFLAAHPRSVAAVRDHDRYAGIRQLAIGNSVSNCEEVRAATRRAGYPGVGARGRSCVDHLAFALDGTPYDVEFSPARSNIDLVRRNLSAGTTARKADAHN